MANRLAAETSPYLRQHADNPVDWYAWGPEALERARELDRPLLVSIGYSACHWCHVMAHESFEDPEVAAAMNAAFVCVKVDREERPDVDAVCMEACQRQTGQGGWPLNCFLTPDGAPFYAGTYFPPRDRPGLPSWRAVLAAVAEAWRERREEVTAGGASLLASLGGATNLPGVPDALAPATLATALEGVRAEFDAVNGGWGGAPKFPQSPVVEFALAAGETEIALATLRAMAAGGICDQVGGGFHRYAVDATWTVPHFEKMLYDNALLARAYLHGFQASGDERLRRTCEETLAWVLAELRGPEGGFLSALDADSEGEEGRYYVWTIDELRDALGPELAEPAIAWLGASPAGNFEGTNVLEGRGPEPPAAERAAIRARLAEVRARRVRPGLDDKRLLSWNALTIAALAEAGAALGHADWVAAAERGAEFIETAMRDPDRPERPLQRTWSEGRGQIDAFLEDHAYLLEALVTLYEATGEVRWYERAVELAETIITRFGDGERGGFFTTAAQGPDGFPRRRDLDDAPIPSGNSAAALGLLRLAALSGETRFAEAALGTLAVLAPLAGRYPLGFGHALRALDFALARTREVAIVGDPGAADARALLDVVRGGFRPHLVLALGSGDPDDGATVPLLRERPLVGDRAAAYVCEGFVCRTPVTAAAALADELAERPSV